MIALWQQLGVEQCIQIGPHSMCSLIVGCRYKCRNQFCISVSKHKIFTVNLISNHAILKAACDWYQPTPVSSERYSSLGTNGAGSRAKGELLPIAELISTFIPATNDQTTH